MRLPSLYIGSWLMALAPSFVACASEPAPAYPLMPGGAGTLGASPTAPAWAPPATGTVPFPSAPQVVSSPPTYSPVLSEGSSWATDNSELFKGDHAFDRFIAPVSNPVLAKDPRAFTETRLIFINNRVPSKHPALGGEDVQLYAVALRLAVTERLQIIADKSGYSYGAGGAVDGWNNLAAGLKYELIRMPEEQFLVSTGFMYEMPTGSTTAFQGFGSGIFSGWVTAAKEFGENFHVISTLGYQFPADRPDHSEFLYATLHVDYRLFGCLYPLAELNWLHYTRGGDRGLPPALGEGDGLLNLGTSGVAGNNLVTAAIGLAYKPNAHMEFSGAWEIPVSSRKDLIDSRFTVGLTLRY